MSRIRIPLVILCTLLLLATFVAWPQMDLFFSGLFYRPGEHFPFDQMLFFRLMEAVAYYAPRILGILFLQLIAVAYFSHRPIFKINAKGWIFLLLALVIGPGLVANGVFKDHWGRARPREIVEFGGTQQFSPAFVPQLNAHRNGSFVSGDASFGFFLPAFAYVVPSSPKRNLSRRLFWGGMGVGGLFGFCRLAMGAHFLSDILFAMVLILGVSAFLHMSLYGRRATANAWKNWFLTAE